MVVVVPQLIIKGSLILIGSTFLSSLVPTTRSKSSVFISKLCNTSGKVPSAPATEPDNESALVNAGSNLVATPISPPGPTSSTDSPPASNPMISEVKLIHLFCLLSLTLIPGLISIMSPNLRVP